ncbi:MAG: hypothetical protein JST91_08590 [Actinobacteria bacterium]|nr:hypothetical protein [Actinomycetota bacterium]
MNTMEYLGDGFRTALDAAQASIEDIKANGLDRSTAELLDIQAPFQLVADALTGLADVLVDTNTPPGPSTEQVLTALSNSVFDSDGSPWTPTRDQVSKLEEIFGPTS